MWTSNVLASSLTDFPLSSRRWTNCICSRVSFLVLAAPDIDADTFRELAESLERVSGHITLYASSEDKAIRASKKLHMNPALAPFHSSYCPGWSPSMHPGWDRTGCRIRISGTSGRFYLIFMGFSQQTSQRRSDSALRNTQTARRHITRNLCDVSFQAGASLLALINEALVGFVGVQRLRREGRVETAVPHGGVQCAECGALWQPGNERGQHQLRVGEHAIEFPAADSVWIEAAVLSSAGL